MKYRIVSDSSSNLTVYDTDVDFRSVPLKIRIDDVEYVDDADLNVADMVAHMQASKKPSTTSCPNSYEWLQAFEGADCIFCVTISANLSGSYNSCVHAREVYLGEHPEAKIKVAAVVAGEPVAVPMQKGEGTETLKAEIDRILQEARDNGKLAELSVKYFGTDLTKE